MQLTARAKAIYAFARVLLAANTLISPLSAFAQANPAATSSSAANSSGSTTNNQNNSQLNTNPFYGFGPGINCPTKSLTISGFGGTGSGSSAGDSIGADADSNNFGALIAFTLPLGGDHSQICKKIGQSQIEQLKAVSSAAKASTAKVQADINLVSATQCIKILKVAVLSGPFKDVCSGVFPSGVEVISTNSTRTIQTFEP